jgi:C6 transcription factor Pro1
MKLQILPVRGSHFQADLTCLKVFNGATGAWQMHLQAAATLAPQMVNAQLSLSEDGSAHLTSQRRLEDLAVLSCEDHTTITLLLGSFIWFDILACASTGSRPFLALDHILILEGDRIHLEELMGCENWVMIVIFQISELDHWKKDSERNCKLSIAELAKRGALIEACLQQRLEKIAVRDTSQNDDISGATLRFSKCTRTIITEIFALAALTYLHVVISGANPGVPEIIESVSRTVTAFKALSDARMLRWLVWPFCVTGCLVSEEDESVFRGLISAGKLSEKTVGTCIEAVKLIEECWKRRQTGLGNCDWVSVMHSLGNLILLG